MLTDKVRQIQSSGRKPSILVIGDLMIDHYIWGQATRLSPEAPVPIVNVAKESTTLGGAANVAQNLVALGARVTLSGVIGEDMFGGRLLELMKDEGMVTEGIIRDAGRPTTVKTRVVAGSHQLVRVDHEVTDPVPPALTEELAETLRAAIESADIIVFSDYGKGLFSAELCQRLIGLARVQQKKVIIDPKGSDYSKYKGAYLIKPNRKELAEAARAERMKTLDDLETAARIVLRQTEADYLVVTLSEEGMVIANELTYKLLPVKATAVFDVTGAGDTVLATIAYFLASGLSLEDACDLANHAAAIVIRRVGSATTTIDEIIQNIEQGPAA